MLYWLMTNTTYGTWLPGDRRGSVTSVRDRRPGDPPTRSRFQHNRPGEPWEESTPGLYRSAQKLMKGAAIYLNLAQAQTLLAQLQETADHRSWVLHALAIMANHFHLVIQAPEHWESDRILADLKAYGTRALTRDYGKPASETWWTTKGSKRKLSTERAVANAINYVLYKQDYPLVVWSGELGRLV